MIVLASKEQESAKVLQELRIDSFNGEPFRERARRLVGIPPRDEPAVQGVGPLLVADSEFDIGGRVRLESGDSGAGTRRFLDEQRELRS